MLSMLGESTCLRLMQYATEPAAASCAQHATDCGTRFTAMPTLQWKRTPLAVYGL